MFIIGTIFFFWDTLYIYVQRNYCVGNARLSLLQVDHDENKLSFELYLLINATSLFRTETDESIDRSN